MCFIFKTPSSELRSQSQWSVSDNALTSTRWTLKDFSRGLIWDTLSNTSRLASGHRVELRPSMVSLCLHSCSVCKSSAEEAKDWARSCSTDSELWSSKPQSWSCASASCHCDAIEAFTQRCWLSHRDAMLSALGCDGTPRDNGHKSLQAAWKIHRFINNNALVL